MIGWRSKSKEKPLDSKYRVNDQVTRILQLIGQRLLPLRAQIRSMGGVVPMTQLSAVYVEPLQNLVQFEGYVPLTSSQANDWSKKKFDVFLEIKLPSEKIASLPSTVVWAYGKRPGRLSRCLEET